MALFKRNTERESPETLDSLADAGERAAAMERQATKLRQRAANARRRGAQ